MSGSPHSCLEIEAYFTLFSQRQMRAESQTLLPSVRTKGELILYKDIQIKQICRADSRRLITHLSLCAWKMKYLTRTHSYYDELFKSLAHA